MIKYYINLVKNINFNDIPLKGTFQYILKKHQPTQLGRWGLLYDDRVNFRIDRSNTDNCGTCKYNKNDLDF